MLASSMKRTPFSVSNGRPHAQSLAAKRRAELAETVANAGKAVTAPVVTKQAPVVASTVPEKPDALANGEFKLFEKGHGAKAENKCGCKEGESCDKCKKDDKKEAWVPPWKKEGVENSGTQTSEQELLANKLAAATKPADAIPNAGNSEGAHAGWLTRRGGVRVDEEFNHEDGSGKHVKLTIQGQNDGQKNIELNLPKDVHAAIAAGAWKPNVELEKHSKGEDFHTIHGYESVTGLRAKYGKGSEADKQNGIIGGQIARAKAYYARARDFGEGTEAQNTLKAKAESIIKEIHDKHHPALAAAKLAHGSGPVVNRGYGALLNSFRGGLLKNYSFDTQEMLDEVMMYAENGEALPDDLREQYEEWLDEQD